MKNLSLKICLVVAALLASVGSGFALPSCPGSPRQVSHPRETLDWTECYGVATHKSASYFGEWFQGMPHGKGTYGSKIGRPKKKKEKKKKKSKKKK